MAPVPLKDFFDGARKSEVARSARDSNLSGEVGLGTDSERTLVDYYRLGAPSQCDAG